MVLINSGFHTRNNLSENIPQFGQAPSELFASPILGRKSLKNIGWKGRQIMNLLGRPHVLGRPWLCGVGWYLFTDVSGQTRGTARPLKHRTDGLFHSSVTSYHPTSRSVPEDRRLIARVCYQMHGSQSFLTTYQPFK